MTTWDDQSKQIAAVTLFVEDLRRSKRFYEEAFSLPVHFESADSAVFRFGGTLINLLQVDSAHELIAPAAVARPDVGSRFEFTIDVGDVDAVCDELVRRGVKLLSGPIDRSWGVRTASFADPDGHIWEIAQ